MANDLFYWRKSTILISKTSSSLFITWIIIYYWSFWRGKWRGKFNSGLLSTRSGIGKNSFHFHLDLIWRNIDGWMNEWRASQMIIISILSKVCLMFKPVIIEFSSGLSLWFFFIEKDENFYFSFLLFKQKNTQKENRTLPKAHSTGCGLMMIIIQLLT